MGKRNEMKAAADEVLAKVRREERDRNRTVQYEVFNEANSISPEQALKRMFDNGEQVGHLEDEFILAKLRAAI